MKILYRKKIFLLLITLLHLFTACSKDNEVINTEIDKNIEETKENEYIFTFKLNVLSEEEEDITTKGELSNASLFIFDSKNKFIKKIDVEKNTILNKRKIEFSHHKDESITVIAWGELENVIVSPMDTSNVISDLIISLIQNNKIAKNPSDIFYGRYTLSRNQANNPITVIPLKRKVAALSIYVSGITEEIDSLDNDYYFLVQCSQSVYDQNGELTGTEVKYIIPAYIDEYKNITINKSSIFPTSCLEIVLYKKDKLIFSVSKDDNNEKLSIGSGEQLGLYYDLSDNSYIIHLSLWDTIIQFYNKPLHLQKQTI